MLSLGHNLQAVMEGTTLVIRVDMSQEAVRNAILSKAKVKIKNPDGSVTETTESKDSYLLATTQGGKNVDIGFGNISFGINATIKGVERRQVIERSPVIGIPTTAEQELHDLKVQMADMMRLLAAK